MKALVVLFFLFTEGFVVCCFLFFFFFCCCCLWEIFGCTSQLQLGCSCILRTNVFAFVVAWEHRK